jgi:hypothetical protein
VQAIVEFMKTDPNRSLGVVTLNQKQRDLIMEEFEYANRNNRAVQNYIDTWKEKNDGLDSRATTCLSGLLRPAKSTRDCRPTWTL